MCAFIIFFLFTQFKKKNEYVNHKIEEGCAEIIIIFLNSKFRNILINHIKNSKH